MVWSFYVLFIFSFINNFRDGEKRLVGDIVRLVSNQAAQRFIYRVKMQWNDKGADQPSHCNCNSLQIEIHGIAKKILSPLFLKTHVVIELLLEINFSIDSRAAESGSGKE